MPKVLIVAFGGYLVAYDDRCPHMGGAACHGRVTGTTEAGPHGG